MKALRFGPMERLEDRITPAVLTWTGGALSGPYYWSDPDNWSSDDVNVSIPTDANDTLYFPAEVTNTSTINDLVDLTVDEILFSGGNYVLTGNGVEIATRLKSTTTDASATVGLDLSGSGAMNVAFGTVVLSGTNTFTGTVSVGSGILTAASGSSLPNSAVVTISEGTLKLFSDTKIGSLSGSSSLGAVDLGCNTLTVGGNGTDRTFAGSITGTGGLNKVGAGQLTLSGSNTFSGKTLIKAGTLAVSGGNALVDSSAVKVVNGATFQVNSDETIGTLTGVGNVSLDDATLTVDHCSDVTFSGKISGTGDLVKDGDGKWTLFGTNSYVGKTTVAQGTLEIAGGSAIPNSSAVTVEKCASLFVLDSETIGSLAGEGFVNLNESVLTTGGNNSSTDFSGTITGCEGALTKTGSGTMTLSGSNIYGGSSTIVGGKLRIAGAKNIGEGAITQHVGSILEITGSTTLANDMNFLGDAIVDVHETVVISGKIDGPKSLMKFGEGTLELTGANSQNGLIVGGGLLRVADASSLGSGVVTLNEGTTLKVTGKTEIENSLQVLADAELKANHEVILSGLLTGTGDLTVNGTGSLALTNSGNKAAFSGGLIVKTTLIVTSGNQVGSGPLTFTGAVLMVNGASTIENSVTLKGAVQINASSGVVFNGNIGGPVTLQKIGAGSITLNGSNSFTGQFEVVAGHLTLSGGSALADTLLLTTHNGVTLSLLDSETIRPVSLGGPVSLGSHTLTVDVASVGMIGGAISGSGGLTKTGTGGLALLGANSYTGATAVDAGSVSVMHASGLPDQSAVTVASGAAILLAANQTIGSLAGGGLVSLLASSMTMGQDNTSTTFSGQLSAMGGSVTKVGSGTMTLSGASVYPGSFLVSGGKVLVDGSLTPTMGGISVAAGTTLGGSGTVGQVAVASGGTLSPGNSPGSLTIIGDLGLKSGSILDVEINGQVAGLGYDQLIVSGKINLKGATLDVSVGEGFVPSANATFTILVNQGSCPIGGTFAGLPEGARFRVGDALFEISYEGGDGNDVVLTSVPAPTVGIASSVNPSVYSETVVFTVTVVDAGLMPTGDVSLIIDGSTYETKAVDHSGVATFTISTLAVGTYTIEAKYLGDPLTHPAEGVLVGGQAVNKAPTVVALGSSLNPSVFGQSVTFTATVTVPKLPKPSGSVEFFNGTNSLGTVALVNGSASITVSSLNVGGQVITAKFIENGSYLGSTSPVVVEGVDHAGVSLSVTPTSIESIVGQKWTFQLSTATISPGAGTPSGMVEVLIDGQAFDNIALDASGKGSFEFLATDAGTFTISFRYLGSENFAASGLVNVPVTIDPGATETILTVSTGLSVVGKPVTLTATVGQVLQDSTSPIAGMVTFYSGDRVLGTAELVNGQASLTLSDLPFGLSQLRAEFEGSSNFDSSSSSVVPVSVTVVMGDYDGDGVTDLALYEYLPSMRVGQFTILLSGGGTLSASMGGEGAIPVVGDFDGDGKSDMGVFDPNGDAATWIIQYSRSGERSEILFGAPNLMDLPAPADYDGDGITDIATFRANSDLVPGAAQWFILPSDGSSAYSVLFGASGGADVPAPADYDGDGKADIATFRANSDLVPGAAQWFILPSSGSDAYSVLFGAGGGEDRPVPADYDGDGKADIATYRPSGNGEQAQWFILPSNGSGASVADLGPVGSIGAPGGYSGPGRSNLGTFDRVLGTWQYRMLDDSDVSSVTYGQRSPRIVPVMSSLADRLAAAGPLSDSGITPRKAPNLSVLDELLENLGSSIVENN